MNERHQLNTLKALTLWSTLKLIVQGNIVAWQGLFGFPQSIQHMRYKLDYRICHDSKLFAMDSPRWT